MFLPNGGKGGGGTENREGYPQLRGGSSSENGCHAGGIVTPVGLLLVDDDEDVRRYRCVRQHCKYPNLMRKCVRARSDHVQRWGRTKNSCGAMGSPYLWVPSCSYPRLHTIVVGEVLGVWRGIIEVSGGVCTVLGFCGKLRSLRSSGSSFMAVKYGGVPAWRWDFSGNFAALRDFDSGLYQWQPLPSFAGWVPCLERGKHKSYQFPTMTTNL